jgi:5,10-methenyltetrahydromethanopterin hydrogenase
MITKAIEALESVGLVSRAHSVRIASEREQFGALCDACSAITDIVECVGTEIPRDRWTALREARRICREASVSVIRRAA